MYEYSHETNTPTSNLLCALCSNERDVAIREGQENLDILKRQVVLGQLYPSATSVMENAA